MALSAKMPELGLSVVFLACLFIAISQAEESKHPVQVSEYELSQRIFTNYSRNRRPVKDPSQAVEVSVFFAYNSIDDILEKTGQLVLCFTMFMTWHNEYLSWNNMPPPYSEIPVLNVPKTSIWLPNLLLINAADNNHNGIIGTNGILVTLLSDGTTMYFPVKKIPVTCSVSMKYFPFDEQTCLLNFEGGYAESEVRFTYVPENYFRLEDNNQWWLISVNETFYAACHSWRRSAPCSAGIEIKLILRRKPLFHIIFVIVPSTVIVVAEIATNAMAADEPIRMEVSFMCLLAYFVLQSSVSDEMPRNGEEIPFLSIYFTLHSAYIILQLFLGTLCIICLKQGRLGRRPNDSFFNIPGISRLWRIEGSKPLALRTVSAGHHAISKEENRKFWMAVVKLIDRFALLAYMLAIIITPCILFHALPPNSPGLITRAEGYHFSQ